MEELKPFLLKAKEAACVKTPDLIPPPPEYCLKKSLSNVGMPDSSTILCLISGRVHADSGLWLKAMKTDGKANTQICTHESLQRLICHHSREAVSVSAGLIGPALSLKKGRKTQKGPSSLKLFFSSQIKKII